MHLNPVEYAIYLFGGVRKLALSLGKHPSTISKWRRHNLGHIPSLVLPDVLREAKKKKFDLTPEDLIFGRKIKK